MRVVLAIVLALGVLLPPAAAPRGAGVAVPPAGSAAVPTRSRSPRSRAGPCRSAGTPGGLLLVVNTASMCGFTYQYAALQRLWEAYRDRGLVVLGVPSNDFGGQEPGSAAEIKSFCEANFDVDFPLTEKVSVRGPGSHPLFAWLRAELGPDATPRWNFHKYLIGPDGRALVTWPSGIEPDAPAVREEVERALAGASL
jgi:glutathione peroxidase